MFILLHSVSFPKNCRLDFGILKDILDGCTLQLFTNLMQYLFILARNISGLHAHLQEQ